MAAVTSIMRAQQILLAELDAQLRPHGLTFARYEALVLITFSRDGALPLRLIGQRLMVHPTSVTNIINRLAAGRALVERATKDLMAAEFGLGGYDAAQLDEISGLLRGLRVAAGDFAETAPAAGSGKAG